MGATIYKTVKIYNHFLFVVKNVYSVLHFIIYMVLHGFDMLIVDQSFILIFS